jgi:hypothetical protein
MKKLKIVSVFLTVIVLGLVLTACGKETSKPKDNGQPLTGAYKTNYTTKDGTKQPSYWYFKKDGTFLYCTPQVNSTNPKSDTEYWYGDAKRGTWELRGNDEYELKMHDLYDDDYYRLDAELDGSGVLSVSDSAKKPKYEYGTDVGCYKQKKMTYSQFMDLFNQAKASDQEKVQNNGYAKPDNDDGSTGSESSSSAASSSSSTSSADPDEIGRAVYKLVFPSEEVDSVEQDGDSYYVSNEYHSADSTIRFQINSDKVTYWTQAAGDTTADGHNEEHTVSISSLLGN